MGANKTIYCIIMSRQLSLRCLLIIPIIVLVCVRASVCVCLARWTKTNKTRWKIFVFVSRLPFLFSFFFFLRTHFLFCRVLLDIWCFCYEVKYLAGCKCLSYTTGIYCICMDWYNDCNSGEVSLIKSHRLKADEQLWNKLENWKMWIEKRHLLNIGFFVSSVF